MRPQPGPVLAGPRRPSARRPRGLSARLGRAFLLTPLRGLDPRGLGLALTISVIWGANPVAIKLGLVDAPPLRLAALRFAVGGVTLLLWAWATGRLAGCHLARHEWPQLIGIGLLFTLQIGTMNVGTAWTSAAHSALVFNLYAVHVVLLAHWLVPGDRLTLRRVLGALVAYAGTAALFGGDSGAGVTLRGDVMMFWSGVVLALRTVCLARMVQRLDPVTLLLSHVAISTPLFWAASALFEPEPTRWTAGLLLSLAYQGVLVTGFNFVVNLWLLRRYRPSALAACFLTQPLFGVLAAALVAGDPLTPALLLAGIAVAAGIGLGAR